MKGAPLGELSNSWMVFEKPPLLVGEVERTFAWLGDYRRFSKDYETLPAWGGASIYLADCDLITKRLARTNNTYRRNQ